MGIRTGVSQGSETEGLSLEILNYFGKAKEIKSKKLKHHMKSLGKPPEDPQESDGPPVAGVQSICSLQMHVVHD